ncbi:MAG: amidohydrolase family protein [Verrucomicrobia bacterium]|nr:amidohydrolase family protein [Verrucomicrobiota bacterium]MCH8528263.1 amidohydrolase family protein [Kiritimatiellia bacterium]
MKQPFITLSEPAGSLTNCLVWVGESLDPTPCEGFAWREGRITEILTRADDGGPPPAYGILPGLVNAHTHVGDGFLPEAAVALTLEEAFFRPHGYKYRALESITAEDHIAHMTRFLQEMAATGTIAHADFREQGVEGARRLREASRVSGVRSFILSQLRDTPFTPKELTANQAPLPRAAREELLELMRISDGFSESTMNDLTDAAWREIRDITAAHHRVRAVHCLENAGYRTLSLKRTEKGDLEQALNLYDPDLIVHLTAASPEEIELLAASGKPAVINPRANAALGLPLPPVAALLQAGVPLLLGTDNGILNGPDLFRELDFTWRLARSQRGDGRNPHPREILKTATANFRHSPWGTEIPGSLSPGLPANFIIVDLLAPCFQNSRDLTATLVTRTAPEHILATVRNGRVLHQREPRHD